MLGVVVIDMSLRQPLIALQNFWMCSIQPSLLIASHHPQKLSKFYAFATCGELQPGINNDHYLIIHRTGMNIQIYRPSLGRPWPKRGKAAALCLQQKSSINPLLSVNEWVERLISRGAGVVERPRLELFGAESWMIDPEGNYFVIFVPINK